MLLDLPATNSQVLKILRWQFIIIHMGRVYNEDWLDSTMGAPDLEITRPGNPYVKIFEAVAEAVENPRQLKAYTEKYNYILDFPDSFEAKAWVEDESLPPYVRAWRYRRLQIDRKLKIERTEIESRERRLEAKRAKNKYKRPPAKGVEEDFIMIPADDL